MCRHWRRLRTFPEVLVYFDIFFMQLVRRPVISLFHFSVVGLDFSTFVLGRRIWLMDSRPPTLRTGTLWLSRLRCSFISGSFRARVLSVCFWVGHIFIGFLLSTLGTAIRFRSIASGRGGNARNRVDNACRKPGGTGKGVHDDGR